MTAVKVSVIIPVYNTDHYLEQCLDSVVSQTLQDIEIICVDDGSTDRSPEILRRYEAEDARIRIVSRENGGLGCARNSGTEIATGEYLAFLDSDDWLDPEVLKKSYDRITKDDADICIFGRFNHLEGCGGNRCYRLLPKRKVYPREQPFSIGGNPESLIGLSDMIVWNKLYRRSFLEENRIRFLPVRRAEDVFFTMVALCAAKRINILNEALIHYRVMRPDSLTATLYEDPEEYIDIWLTTAEELRKRGVYPERCVANLAWGTLLWVMQRTRWPEFTRLYDRIKTEALPRLGIQLHEPGYYFYAWQEELLKHLYQEKAEEFLLSWLLISEMRDRENTSLKQEREEKYREEISGLRTKISEQKKKNAALKARIQSMRDTIKALKKSVSYRIGRAITAIPRSVRKGVNRLRHPDGH